jgi:hypothetical protein
MYTTVLTRWIGRGRSESCRDCVRVDNSLLPWPAVHWADHRWAGKSGKRSNGLAHGVPRPLVL